MGLLLTYPLHGDTLLELPPLVTRYSSSVSSHSSQTYPETMLWNDSSHGMAKQITILAADTIFLILICVSHARRKRNILRTVSRCHH